MNKKVSIIISTYNGERYIKETIDSCLNQTYSDIEIIVIDDCSSDNTINILREYGEKIKLKPYFITFNNLDIVKSLLMCLNLYLGSLFFSILTKKAFDYLYEAIKWSLLNTYFYLMKNNNDFNKIINFYLKISNDNLLFKKIQSYRKDNIFPKKNILDFLSLILKIHLKYPKKYLKIIK